MESSYQPLPFFFRENSLSKRYFLSNYAGSFSFLDSRDDLVNLIDCNIEGLASSKLEELFAKSIICSQDEIPTRANLLASHLASHLSSSVTKPSLFIVVPTLRCDHNCHYCQVSRVPIDRTGYDVTDQHIESILDIIEDIGGDTIKIEFQGGEPLLRFDFVKEVIERATERFQSHNLAFTICSALGPLTVQMLDWLKQYNVHFSVSLDGPQHIHDANRPSIHVASYTNTIEKIDLIQKVLGVDYVDCIATVSNRSLKEPLRLVDEYFKCGFSEIFFRPISPYGFASNMRHQYTPDEYFRFYKCALDRIIALNKQRLFVDVGTLIHLRKIFSPSKNTYVDLQSPAGYIFGAIVFNYDGNVFGSDEARMLWEATGNIELVLGNIGQKQSLDFGGAGSTKLLSDTFNCTSPGCDECAYQPYCGSDPLHHLSTQGDHVGDKSRSFFCKSQQLIFDHLFSLLDTDEEAREVFRTWLRQ